MPISYLDPNSKKIIREPLTKRFRSFYRSPRKSGQENLFNQKIFMDMNRVYLELELLDTAILDKVKIFLGAEKDETHEIRTVLDEVTGEEYYGRVYDLSADSISMYNYTADDTIDYLETTDTIGGSLSRLFYKINKLEKQTG
jgi:hypothetical protein